MEREKTRTWKERKHKHRNEEKKQQRKEVKKKTTKRKKNEASEGEAAVSPQHLAPVVPFLCPGVLVLGRSNLFPLCPSLFSDPHRFPVGSVSALPPAEDKDKSPRGQSQEPEWSLLQGLLRPVGWQL